MSTNSLEAYSRSSVVEYRTIKAGGFEGIGHYGESFYVIAATAPFEAKTELTAYKPYRAGTGEKFPEELRFKRLEFRNPNAFDITVMVWVGFGKYIDNRLLVIEGFTEVVARAGTTIPAYNNNPANIIWLDGAPNGNRVQRKAVIVSNPDSQSDLQVVDEAGNIVATVFYRSSCNLPIAGKVGIRNVNGSAVTASVSEIWYVQVSS